MGERIIDPKFNIHTSYKKMNIINPYKNNTGGEQPPAVNCDTIVDDYKTRVQIDGGIIENETNLRSYVDTFTCSEYTELIGMYNPNGGYKQSKIYNIRSVTNNNPNDLTVTGGGGTRFLADGSLESISNNKAKIDYSTGQPAFLIEPERTNSARYSYDLTSYYNSSDSNHASAILNETGITGEPNTATTITDSDTGYASFLPVNNSGSLVPGKNKVSVWVKKQSGNNVHEVGLIISGNFDFRHIDSTTGNTAVRSGYTLTNNFSVIDRGDWWEMIWVYDNINNYTSLNINIRPAMASLGTYGNAPTDSMVVGHIGIYDSSVVNETPIITNGSAVTRTENIISIQTPPGTVEIEEIVDGNTNLITTIPSTYQMPQGRVDAVIFK